MPRKYKRKPGVIPRLISWTEESLAAALEEMSKNIMGINEISRAFGIPSRTLRRRFAKKNAKILTLGKHPTLGFDNEVRLVQHIKRLEISGFPPDRQTVRSLAYQFAQKLEIKHNFNSETKQAGKEWLQSFLDRHPELSVRQAEGLSVARATSLNREDIQIFYELLVKVCTDNDLLDKPERIYNMDETGVQLNNKTGKVIATKGSRAVHTITSGEKGETITVVACCNAIGNFLPPVAIIKGVHNKPEFLEGLPAGSKVYMNKKSAYINSELFLKWLTEHFIPMKPQGKVLLILDGHSSHSSALELLETAKNNNVVLLCLPSHTTSVLQPLDRAVFKPFKTFFSAETNHFMRTNPQKKLTRYQSGNLIGKAWIRATTPSNAIAGFRGSGIYPVNRNAIPDSLFAISDANAQQNNIPRTANMVNSPTDVLRYSPSILTHDVMSQTGMYNDPIAGTSTDDMFQSTLQKTPPSVHIVSDILTGQTRISTDVNTSENRSGPSTDNVTLESDCNKETPSKLLHDTIPIPILPTPLGKRAKQAATVLNSDSNIMSKKGKLTKGIAVKKSKSKCYENKENNIDIKRKRGVQPCKNLKNKKNKRMKIMKIYSSSEEDDNETGKKSDDGGGISDDLCVECLENYNLTKSDSDWIRCVMCKYWLHESCTLYSNYCNKCGRLKIIASKAMTK